MASCPQCHIYKGVWAPLSRNCDGSYVCTTDRNHRFTRDNEGNFHSLDT